MMVARLPILTVHVLLTIVLELRIRTVVSVITEVARASIVRSLVQILALSA